MPTDPRPSDPRSAWQSQPTEDFRMTPALLERYVSSSRQRLRWLRAAQCLGGTAGLIGYAAIAVTFDGLMMRSGAALLALVFAFTLVLLYRTRRALDLGTSAAAPLIEFYRADLERQRQLWTGFRLWSRLVIGVPAACVLFAGFARAHPSLARIIYLELAAALIALGIAFVGAHRRARRYQQEIEELDALRR
jgi:asparagine N-glycosylation enzyme membrane subunit Stt3